jgi:hypothetical protein
VVGAIGRMLEIQGRGPVIGKVIRHLAGSAGGPRANVTRHGGIESVATNDVMNMGGWERTWIAGGIKALKGQS